MVQEVPAGLKARSQVSPFNIRGAQMGGTSDFHYFIIPRMFHTHISFIRNQLLHPLFLPIGLRNLQPSENKFLVSYEN